MSKTPIKKVKKRKPVPVAVINELKIALVLRGYSSMTEQGPMSVREQWLWLERFYHGKGNTHPSQVDMLVKGIGFYADLFDSVTPTVTDKNHQGVGYQLILKNKFLPDSSKKYIAGVDILASELEKKSRSSKQLVTGRNLLDIANRNMKKHRKAIGFASHLWDLDKNIPIKSGTTEDDVIEYVRCKMWYYIRKKQEKKRDDGGGSDSSDEEAAAAEEDALLNGIEAALEKKRMVMIPVNISLMIH